MKNGDIVTSWHKRIGYMAFSLLKGYVLLNILVVVLAFFVTYSDFSFAHTSSIIMGAAILACFVTGYDFSCKNQNKGLMYGGLGGILFGVIYILLGYMLTADYVIGVNSIIVIVIGTIAGGLGGVLGVNKK